MEDVDLVRVLDLASEAALVLRRPDATRPGAAIVHANRAFLDLTRRSADALAGRSARALREILGPRSVLNELLGAVADGVAWAGLAELSDGSEPPRAMTGRGGPVAANACLYLVWLGPAAMPAANRMPGERGPVLAGLTRECFYELEVDLDCRLRLIWADPRVVELTGYELEELLAEGGINRLVVDADRHEVARRNQRLLAGEEVTARYRIQRKDETIRLIRDTARPEWSADGSVVTRVIGALAEPAAEPADATLGPALERATGLLAAELDVFGFMIDLHGRVRWAAARPAGPVPDLVRGLVGQTLTPVQSPLAVDLWLDGLEAAAQRREPVSARQSWRLAAREVEVSLQLVGLTDELVLVLVRDPGALGPFNEATGARAVLGSVRAPLALLGLDLTVRTANAAFERLTGAATASLTGRPLLEWFVAPSGRAGAAELLERVQSRREPVRSFGLPCLIEGRERPADLHLAPVLDAAGALVGITLEAQPTASTAALPPGDAAPWFDAIVDTIADGILTLDATGAVTWLSKAAAAIFDGANDAIVGAKITSLLTAGAGQSVAALDALLDTDAARAGPVEALARRGSGESVPVEVAAAALEEGGRRRRVLIVRDITVRRQTEETLKSLAYHDPLTGLPNRLLFVDRLAQAIERARRGRQLLTVLLIDLDRFKLINDSLGLEKGDQVLRVVAERLSAALRRSDTVARLSGDEFMVLLLGTTGAESAAKVAQKLLDALRPPMQIDGHELTTAASIGIALFPHDGDAADALIKNADTALTRAKEQGRNHYQFYAVDMNASAFERLMLETRLRRALEQEELAVFYQPKVSLEDGRITGVEALLRWFHPELGLVPPSEFIPLAEETGLIVPIGEWVLRAACAQVHRWHLTGHAPLQLAVNISARQFQQRNLTETVAAIVAGAGLPPTALELELTESVIMRDAAETVRRLRELRTLGIRLSIDDFGTGYSSLGYLRTFPIASLKIDRSFVRDIDKDANSAAIAQSIIALARTLSLNVIAEGVETREQVAWLREHGCHELQGYVFARPLPADELVQLLRIGKRLEV